MPSNMDIKHEELGKLKVGRYMIMDDRPCEITKMERSSPGKHGHAKYRVTGADLITRSKKQGIWGGHDKVQVPIIEKKTAQVLSVSEDSAQLMDFESYETFETKIPEEFKEQIIPNAHVMYWVIMDVKVIKGVKSGE